MTNVRIEVERFDGEGDFSLWKKRMLAHLSVLGLKDVLLETAPQAVAVQKDEDPVAAKARVQKAETDWFERSEKAMNLIFLNVGDRVLRKLDECTSAASTWSTLERLYLSKSLPNRIYLQHKFYTFKMNQQKTIDENTDDFLKVVSELASVKVSVSEEVQAILLLNSLPESYNSLKETLKYGRKTLTLEEVISDAKSKEREIRENPSSQRSGEAFVVRGRPEKREPYNKKYKGSSRSRSGSGSRVTCWYCKKEGHLKKDCYSRKKRMEEEEHGTAAVVLDKVQVVDALSVSVRNPNDRWIIDSGCSYHMTSRRDWFDEFTEVTGNQVLLADDSSMVVQGIGSVRISATGGSVTKLTNVRYIPNLARNLISVGTLDVQGFTQEGGNGKTRFYKNKKLALQGTLTGTGGLYLLDGETVTVQSNHVVSKDDTALWHSRMGHTSMRNLKVLVEKGILDKKKISDLSFCESCIMGKNKRLSFSIGKHNSEEVLRYVHADLWGSPNVTLSMGKKQYFMSIIDDCSRKVWVQFLATKDEAFEKFVEWKILVENQVNQKVKCLRTDNGLEFCNKEFDEFCRKQGIERHRTCAYTPQQNGVAERMNRTIMEKVRCLLNETGLEEKFWAEAVSTAVYIINRTPSSANDFNIPEEIWLKKTPGYAHMRRFGSVVYVHVDQGKLKPRALKGVFIGYPQGVKGYKIWLIQDKKVVISRNAVFQEETVYKDLVQDKQSGTGLAGVKQRGTGTMLMEASGCDKDITILSDSEDEAEETSHEGGAAAVVPDSEAVSDSEAGTGRQEESLDNFRLARDRVRREIRKPVRYRDNEDEEEVVAFALSVGEILDSKEPSDYTEALDSKDWKKWNSGMDEEMDSLMKNGTWILVDLPKGQKTIGCKWVYKLKPGIAGVEQPRHKARLVAKGYAQREGIDYQEVFSPVVKHVSIRFILSVVVNLDLELEQLDVKTAFLHGDIDEDIYMKQPEGYVVKGKEDKVCYLKKSLYGLKQAPRQWNKCFDQVMVKHEFIRSEYDHCVYYKEYKKEVFIYLLLYVDDMLIACKSSSEIDKVKRLLSSEFEMKDLGAARKILGMEIVRDRIAGTLTLSQASYIRKVLQVFRMDDAKSVTTPLGSHFKLAAATEDETAGTSEFPYSNAVGSLMYAMIGTRPDLAYAVGMVSRFMSNPGQVHWSAVQWILRYLNGTQDRGLVFRKNEDFRVEGYSDSDYAADLDRRRSISGYVFSTGGNTVSWKSSLQGIVTLSTTEAEYIALTEAAKEGIWLKGLAEELGFKQGMICLHCDSQSAICLTKNNMFHGRTKHMAVRFNFIRDLVEDGEIAVKKIHTSKNPADMLTKAIPVKKFEQALAMLRIAKC